MAAVLGARMNQTMIEVHSLKVDRCVLWTDSRTVWSWIRSDQHRYKQFVAFRIGEILELTKTTDWRWVPTKQNVADILTKWHRSSDLESEGVWYTGPTFLNEPEDQWPALEVPIEKTCEEARGHLNFHGVVEVERCSRWKTLQRVMAYVIRFIDNCKRKVAKLSIVTVKSEQRPLERDEFRRAQIILWKQAQHEAFPDEMSILTKNLDQRPGESPATVRKNSSLYKLTPFLDEDGVLRFGGRMERAENMPYDKKFPIILPRKHATTEKLIQSYHEKYGHANRETVMNELQQRFWIPNARTAIRQTTVKCVWCKEHRCQPHVPKMAPHSTQRVTPYQRLFSSVGIDYLGPIEVTVGRRREKRWVAVFTCLAIRAVHLEVVPRQTTQS
ncbi:uncharacterized protein LOC129720516 [Wyeomyia smithii]|uniref:uncharacterized protein LOC129720516 n=1 Tax=Wyeomyia smithii TaxID=174621 RepID=UPI002467E3F8|nr:uncharacterized protein LOC129720516 [Wyeomyia smithii]